MLTFLHFWQSLKSCISVWRQERQTKYLLRSEFLSMKNWQIPDFTQSTCGEYQHFKNVISLVYKKNKFTYRIWRRFYRPKVYVIRNKGVGNGRYSVYVPPRFLTFRQYSRYQLHSALSQSASNPLRYRGETFNNANINIITVITVTHNYSSTRKTYAKRKECYEYIEKLYNI